MYIIANAIGCTCGGLSRLPRPRASALEAACWRPPTHGSQTRHRGTPVGGDWVGVDAVGVPPGVANAVAVETTVGVIAVVPAGTAVAEAVAVELGRAAGTIASAASTAITTGPRCQAAV